jgi:hypothetical protein
LWWEYVVAPRARPLIGARLRSGCALASEDSYAAFPSQEWTGNDEEYAAHLEYIEGLEADEREEVDPEAAWGAHRRRFATRSGRNSPRSLQPREARKEWQQNVAERNAAAETYTQHNPHVGNGKQAFVRSHRDQAAAVLRAAPVVLERRLEERQNVC